MAKESYVKTAMTGVEQASPRPSGNVVTNGKMTNIDVPERTTGPDSIPEVIIDNNVGLPGRSA